MDSNKDVIGLIPAAGFAKRVSPLPCSKEIYPILPNNSRARVASSYLMESLRKADVSQTYLVLRKGKWDIPKYFKDGSMIGLDLAYIIVEATGGVPQTIDKAYPFIKQSRVLLGFPDILFKPSNAFKLLIEKQEISGADLVLGLFKTTKPEKSDMVTFDSEGNLKDIVIKPEKTDLTYSWIIAAWTPVFSKFLHEYLANYSELNTGKNNGELPIGDVVRAAIHSGLKTSYVKFENGSFLDIGTPADLKKLNDIDRIKEFEEKN